MRILALLSLLLIGSPVLAASGIAISRDAVSAGGGPASSTSSSVACIVGQTATGTSRSGNLVESCGYLAWPVGNSGGPMAVPENGVALAATITIGPNTPNPFRAATAIRYSIPTADAAGVRVVFRIFDTAGRLVRVLDQGTPSPGIHFALWDARNQIGSRVGAGVYYGQMQAGRYQAVRRMVVLH